MSTRSAKGRAKRGKSAAKPKRRRRYNPDSRWHRKKHSLIKGAAARQVRTGRRNQFVGAVPMTRLNGKMVDGESLLELDALVIIDNEGGFRDVIAQPFQLMLDVAGRIRRWTPDFQIVKDGRDLLVEVKCLSWLYHRDPAKAALARSRIKAIESACARRDCDFMLLTEDEIRVEPRLYNASICHRHNAPHLVPREMIVVGLSALAAAPDELTIEQFAHLIAPVHPIHALGLAVRLERLGHVRIDRRTRYSLSSTMVKTSASPSGARA